MPNLAHERALEMLAVHFAPTDGGDPPSSTQCRHSPAVSQNRQHREVREHVGLAWPTPLSSLSNICRSSSRPWNGCINISNIMQCQYTPFTGIHDFMRISSIDIVTPIGPSPIWQCGIIVNAHLDLVLHMDLERWRSGTPRQLRALERARVAATY